MKAYIFILIALIFSLASCEDALDLKPKGSLTVENYYQNTDDARAAINAIYDVLGYVNQYNSSLWLLQDVASDDCDVSDRINDPNLLQFDRYELLNTNIYLNGIWQESYDGIHRANIALEKIPGISMDETLKARFIGEAEFLRGLFYFNLVRLFGNVPLITFTSNNLSDYLVPGASKESLYDQIISDFTSASTKLPSSYGANNKGRATKGAALGQLAKVYLTLENWDMAAEKARLVKELNVYGLWDKFEDNFKEANANGKESVFEVQFYSAEVQEQSRIVITGLPAIYAFPAGVGTMVPTPDLLNEFDEGDHRYEATFFDNYFYFGENKFRPHIWKHWDKAAYPAAKTGASGANFPVMRYAEVLLIYAEALNEANGGPTEEAYKAVNDIRKRARNGVDTVLLDLNGLDQQAFREAVWKEKRCETVNEGQRWYDLVRTNRLVERVKQAKGEKTSPESYNVLFPIPQRERDLNSKLEQNEGYN